MTVRRTAPAQAPGTTPGTTPFSTLIRTASQEQHTEAENSGFITDLLGGRLGVAAYRLYTEQLWLVYEALEDAAEGLAGDPVAGPFLDPALLRRDALTRDLDHLHDGADWRGRLRPLPATVAYADRITEVGRSWPGGYVAHHYTRYLGDLSGGQVIRDRAERLWGLPRKGDGVRFYVFEHIGNPAAFKRDYRARLDALPADDLEKQRIVEECRRAFALNTAVFAELRARAPQSA
jgi:heme oxygenase (biliverdin-producing, ferredoxin)